MCSAMLSSRSVSVLAALVACVAVSADELPHVDYLTDIKPIFHEHCVSCHGSLQQSGGLRLDTAGAMFTGGDSGPAIIPGETDSLLIEVLRGGSGFTMPPEGEGTPPSDKELSLIEHWVIQGAEAPETEEPQADPATYWSYQPLTDVTPPAAGDTDWIRNEIDQFTSAQHRNHGLKPVPPAPSHVLLRRVYLDLVGYPPTRDQLARFTANPSDEAYEAVVDDLLSRPGYGERWGRHWMDVWRYSDWYGRRSSNEIRYGRRHIWRWRDWIIRSLNQDKGYDQMITEMLAGDEISPTDPDVLAATGFLGRNWYKFDKNTWLFETVEQTSRGLMAMTLECCRCHDHKYDPIAQVEYYRFRAIFEPHGFRTDPVHGAAESVLDNGKEKVLSDGLARAFDNQLDAPTYVFRRGDDRDPDTENPLTPGVPQSLGSSDFAITEVSLPADAFMPQIGVGASVHATERAAQAIKLAEQKRDKKLEEVSRLTEQIAVLKASDIAVSALSPIVEEFDTIDPKRWKALNGDWTAKDGKLIQSQVTSFATLVSTENHPRNFAVKVRYRKLQPGRYRSVGFSFDRTDSGKDSQDVYTARVDGRPQGSVQAFHRQAGKQTYPPEAIVPVDIDVGKWIDLEFEVRETQLTIRVDGEEKLNYTLPLERVDGKFAIWVHTGSAEFERLSISPLVASIRDLEAAMVAARHQVEVAELEIELAAAKGEFEQKQITAERLRLGVEQGDAMSAADQASRAQRYIAVVNARIEALRAQRNLNIKHTKENLAKHDAATKKVDEAQQRVTAADGTYTQLKSEYPEVSTGRRLALARWLTRPEHPRTSRVAVNHIWMRHLGSPLVESVDNFGLSGKRPSHPDLLDWLARQLVGNGWSMKHLHKQIVLSATYRLSSRASRTEETQNETIDRSNTYLWRAVSRRMEAEVVRDSILAASGAMDVSLGGPDIDEKKGQTSYRRSLYYRTTPDNQMQMLSLFDQANPTECYRRRESVVPQQALALMNSPLAVDMSRRLAESLTGQLAAADPKESQHGFIRAAFETILSRSPTDQEIRDCAEFLTQSAELLADPKRLTTFPAASAKSTVKPSANPVQRARESLVHVLFNHNEFVTIR